ncbi:PucR family transcriptional regulator [Saccharothrix syringae]|uniref:PucR family transcriptional regulator n=2 Tax=Saccharothrix syringae TaxID=103733 RepID=A0A5Q0H4W8_SACSY|nr:helix-turn-helix domain-containing protein [Saccharothrix syringae]QFZ20870.1 PucR family transcriptional regulator [Saccharothrix syringae]
MRGLFVALEQQAEANARDEVAAYRRELPEYRAVAADPGAKAAMLDHAVWLRRRAAALAPDARPLTEQDRARITSIGRLRGAQGVSLTSARRAVVLHCTLVLHEIHTAAGPNDLADLLGLTRWFGAQGEVGTSAYFSGFLEGQKRSLGVTDRVQQLARMLLADDAMARHVVASLGMPPLEHCTVVVIRVPEATGGPPARDDAVEHLFKRYRVPMSWTGPAEFVALVPGGGTGSPWLPVTADEQALALVRDFATLVDRPCAVGWAAGRVPRLAEAAGLARQAARVAPVQAAPRRMHGVADVFVEVAVAHLPHVERWLREVARRLATGPDLISTLDCYYRNDFNRQRTAESLCIHPRTLDHRLHRTRELTDIDPRSSQGVRILGTAIARTLADAWD